MKIFRWAFLPFASLVLMSLACCSCSEAKEEGAPPKAGTITLMTWNVNNLFDGIDNGYEYDEFLTSAGWSKEKYLGRVNVISAAIGTIDPLPDIIMLQEVESINIVDDIASTVCGGYKWSHFAANPGASLGVGIMSRLPICGAMAHTVTVNGETTPRPVLEARIQAEGGANGASLEEIVVFVCHWKSKLGGDEATESVRRASARAILRRIRELWENEPEIGVIVAGDLNENHDEFFRQKSSQVCALVPDDPFCAQFTGCIGADGEGHADMQKDFIVISKNKPPEPGHFPEETIVLFSPWLRDLEKGSYMYVYNWETIDHFLVSGQFFNNTGIEYEMTNTANFPPFVNANGVPVSYNLRTGLGMSDHLPLLLTLRL